MGTREAAETVVKLVRVVVGAYVGGNKGCVTASINVVAADDVPVHIIDIWSAACKEVGPWLAKHVLHPVGDEPGCGNR